MRQLLRRLERGEEVAFVRSLRVPFLDPSTGSPDDEVADRRTAEGIEAERMWVVEDRGQFVGNGGVRTMDLTVPASPGSPCPVVPMGGVTTVGIHPTHRRQGLLSQMMAGMLDDCRQREEPVAGLIASESVIYGRYGFGLASNSAEYRIDSARSAFAKPIEGRHIRLVDQAEASKLLPGIFDAARPARAGEPNRTAHFWREVLEDRPTERHGASGAFYSVCDDGYAIYRAKRQADLLRGERIGIVVEEIAAADPETQAALWRFVLDIDLIGDVTVRRRPVDEPVRWRLTDPRQLQTSVVYDRLYLRIVDVAAALQSRGYRGASHVVLEVVPGEPATGAASDPSFGRWALEAGPDGSRCGPAAPGQSPDLRLDLASLGSLYLGGVRASTLAAAGRVEELSRGALETADHLFAATPLPSTVTGF
ncbi:MAG: GNAT family N-acetyltransferase [Acidimicrobiales bacterium]|nr:GNAT family N-acetyltransferase [Acidimicrobiales bacterium]